MSSPVGILVEGNVLAKAIRGHKTREKISLYREIALRDLEIPIIVFSNRGVYTSRNRVKGYVPTSEGWKKATWKIPRVIHKRVLYRTNAPLKMISKLRRRGVIFINPQVMNNKAQMHALLSKDQALRSHLPRTEPFRWTRLNERLGRGQSVILKPRVGSVGQGIKRVVPVPPRRVSVTRNTPVEIQRRSLRRYLGRRIRPSRYLIQEYIDLAQYDERPFDLRVPVQRDGDGAWCVPGMVAKVAGAHPFLTNIAQGGRALPGEEVLRSAFEGESAEEIIEDVRDLAIRVADRIAQTYEHAADLGLDIGVDTLGKPWLIEVNARDQRITFEEAGLHETFRTLYRNPLAYSAFLAEALEAKR